MAPPRPRSLWLLLLAAAGSVFLPAGTGPSAQTSELKKSGACSSSPDLALQWRPRWRRKFNLSTPGLLGDGLFTQELWGSLSRRRAPYGWQGLARETVASTLSSASEGLGELAALCWRPGAGARLHPCAVVGNGGILKGSRRGQNIDAHGYVFTLNGAVTQGFEQDVGTKTSFYGFTVNTMKNSLLSYRALGFTSVPQGQNLRYIIIPLTSATT